MNRRELFSKSAECLGAVLAGRVMPPTDALTDWRMSLTSELGALERRLNASIKVCKESANHSVMNLTSEFDALGTKFSRLEFVQYLILIWCFALSVVTGLDLITPFLRIFL